MFRFNQKKANREADEVKRLLSIMKGIKKSGQSNVTYLKEAEDSTLNVPVDAPEDKALPNATPEQTAKTAEQTEFEEGTNDSEVTEMSDSIVKAEKYEGKLKFTYDVDKKNPTFESDEIELDEDTIKTLQIVKEYWVTWKDLKKKKK